MVPCIEHVKTRKSEPVLTNRLKIQIQCKNLRQESFSSAQMEKLIEMCTLVLARCNLIEIIVSKDIIILGYLISSVLKVYSLLSDITAVSNSIEITLDYLNLNIISVILFISQEIKFNIIFCVFYMIIYIPVDL